MFKLPKSSAAFLVWSSENSEHSESQKVRHLENQRTRSVADTLILRRSGFPSILRVLVFFFLVTGYQLLIPISIYAQEENACIQQVTDEAGHSVTIGSDGILRVPANQSFQLHLLDQQGQPVTIALNGEHRALCTADAAAGRGVQLNAPKTSLIALQAPVEPDDASQPRTSLGSPEGAQPSLTAEALSEGMFSRRGWERVKALAEGTYQIVFEGGRKQTPEVFLGTGESCSMTASAAISLDQEKTLRDKAKHLSYTEATVDQVAQQLADEVLGVTTAREVRAVTSILYEKLAHENELTTLELIAAMRSKSIAKIAEELKNKSEAIKQTLAEISPETLEAVTTRVKSLIFNQFSSPTRPIVELLLNAIDTEDRYAYKAQDSNYKKRVEWEITDGRALIRDFGEGITPETLALLLNPGETGNMIEAGTTGKFGAGFFSILSYLYEPQTRMPIPSARVVIRGQAPGGQSWWYEIWADELGNLKSSKPILLSPTETAYLGTHGTEIEVYSPQIKKDEQIEYAHKYLKGKDDAEIVMVTDLTQPNKTEILNPQDKVEVIAQATVELDGKTLPVQFKQFTDTPKTDLKNNKTEVRIEINGVYFESIFVESYGQPQEITLNFAKDLMDYARDRGDPRPNYKTMLALEALVKAMAMYGDEYRQFISLTSILLPVVSQLENRAIPPPVGVALLRPTQVLKDQTKQMTYMLEKEITVLSEDVSTQALIEDPNVIFVPQELLPEGKPKWGTIFAKDRENEAIRFVPFKSNSSSKVAVTKNGVILADTSLQPILKHPETRDEVLPIIQAAIESVAMVDHKQPISLLPARQKTEILDVVQTELFSERVESDYKRLLATIDDQIKHTSSQSEYFSLLVVRRALKAAPQHVHLIKKGIEHLGWEAVLAILKQVRFRDDFKAIQSPNSREVAFFDIEKALEINPIDEVIEGVMVERLKNMQGTISVLNPDNIHLRAIWFTNKSRKPDIDIYDHSIFDLLYGQFDGQPLVAEIGYFPEDLSSRLSHQNPIFQEIPYPISNYLQGIYRYLLGNLIEKNQIMDFKDAEEIANLTRKIDDLIVRYTQNLTTEEIKNALYKLYIALGRDIRNISYLDIKQNLEMYGSYDQPVALALNQILGDIPSLGKPENAIEGFEENEILTASSLIQARGANKTAAAAFKTIQSVGDLDKIQTIIDDHLAPEDREELGKRAQTEIKAAVQQTSDPFAFLREITTNAWEAMRQLKTGMPGTMSVKTWPDGNKLVAALSDTGSGMGVAEMIGNLFQPSASGWKLSDQLHFGQGFYSLFVYGDEVRLRSTKNGVTTTAIIKPVNLADGTVIDLDIQFSERIAQTGEAGTTVEWHKNTDDPMFLTSQLYVQMQNYVGLFDPRQMLVDFNGTIVNKDVQALAENTEAGDRVSFVAAKGRWAFHLNQFYLRDLTDDFTASIPKLSRDLLKAHGMVFNLDSQDAEPLEGRTDFVGRAEKLKARANLIAKTGLQAAAKLISEGAVGLEGLPYDLFGNAAGYKQEIETKTTIAADAKKLEAGEDIDWAHYREDEQDERLLLISIPAISIADGPYAGKYSYLDAIIRGTEDADFLALLPQELRGKIESNTANTIAAFADAQEKADELGLADVNPTPIKDLKENAQVLQAWSQLVQAVLSPVLKEHNISLSHQFFVRTKAGPGEKDGPPLAQTSSIGGKSLQNIDWNVPYIHDMLYTLERLLSATYQNGQWLDSQGQIIDPAEIAAMWYRIAETASHELTHIVRNEGERVTRHDTQFFKDQAKLLATILNSYLQGDSRPIQFQALIAQLQQDLNPDKTLAAALTLPEAFQVKESQVIEPDLAKEIIPGSQVLAVESKPADDIPGFVPELLEPAIEITIGKSKEVVVYLNGVALEFDDDQTAVVHVGQQKVGSAVIIYNRKTGAIQSGMIRSSGRGRARRIWIEPVENSPLMSAYVQGLSNEAVTDKTKALTNALAKFYNPGQLVLDRISPNSILGRITQGRLQPYNLDDQILILHNPNGKTVIKVAATFDQLPLNTQRERMAQLEDLLLKLGKEPLSAELTQRSQQVLAELREKVKPVIEVQAKTEREFTSYKPVQPSQIDEIKNQLNQPFLQLSQAHDLQSLIQVIIDRKLYDDPSYRSEIRGILIQLDQYLNQYPDPENRIQTVEQDQLLTQLNAVDRFLENPSSHLNGEEVSLLLALKNLLTKRIQEVQIQMRAQVSGDLCIPSIGSQTIPEVSLVELSSTPTSFLHDLHQIRLDLQQLWEETWGDRIQNSESPPSLKLRRAGRSQNENNVMIPLNSQLSILNSSCQELRIRNEELGMKNGEIQQALQSGQPVVVVTSQKSKVKSQKLNTNAKDEETVVLRLVPGEEGVEVVQGCGR